MMPSPNLPTIPETITVHLGRPDSNAENVTVGFSDYIKNVASSEIYPTWPENAIRANIYAQISFALSRLAVHCRQRVHKSMTSQLPGPFRVFVESRICVPVDFLSELAGCTTTV